MLYVIMRSVGLVWEVDLKKQLSLLQKVFQQLLSGIGFYTSLLGVCFYSNFHILSFLVLNQTTSI